MTTKILTLLAGITAVMIAPTASATTGEGSDSATAVAITGWAVGDVHATIQSCHISPTESTKQICTIAFTGDVQAFGVGVIGTVDGIAGNGISYSTDPVHGFLTVGRWAPTTGTTKSYTETAAYGGMEYENWEVCASLYNAQRVCTVSTIVVTMGAYS